MTDVEMWLDEVQAERKRWVDDFLAILTLRESQLCLSIMYGELTERVMSDAERQMLTRIRRKASRRRPPAGISRGDNPAL